MTKVRVIRRDEDGEAGAVLKTVRLAAVVTAFNILHLGTKPFQHRRTKHILTIRYTIPLN